MATGKDPEYLGWVRTLPCASCEAPGPSEAHHHTHGRGMSQKNPDRFAVPLCQKCHRDFHDCRGKMDLNKAGRTQLQDAWLWCTEQRWLREQEAF